MLKMKLLKKKTKENYEEKMRECEKITDIKKAHEEADAVLCNMLGEMGYTKTVNLFIGISKWYA